MPPTKRKPATTTTTTGKRKQRRQQEDQTIEELAQQSLDLIKDGPPTHLQHFTDLPLSHRTLQGLEHANYLEMTEIQHRSLPYALTGRDILGAAKTGSGKTLAFLIPILERLYRLRWNPQDGLGALVIAPTRELAVQIFEVLTKVGSKHLFSAGLVIGGKRVEEEKEILGRMNILVGTPGRLLQHMDETVGFDCNQLKVLVLDEADRILDLGFKKTMNAILENLPKQRQTLLFSATQTKSVKSLARLSLQRPEYVAVHEKDQFSTPSRLSQYMMVVDLPQKLDFLYSFLKTHLKSKIIVFLSSGKQVRFVFETFCKLQPGVPLLHLHGKQKQMRRVEIFEKFKKMTKAAMFCTDLAARGLDFPAVDWVVQVDCPEDCDTYLHRVGRTARYEASGKSLLFLTPSEAPAMTEAMQQRNIPIKEISPKANKVRSVVKQLQHFCFQDSEIKYLGQRAFVTYVRSVFLQKNKKVFDVKALPLEEFAEALGLPGAPKIKFVGKSESKKNQEYDNDMSEVEEDGGPKTRVDKMFARKNTGVLADHYQKLVEEDSDDDKDFLTLKRADHKLTDSEESEDEEEEEEEGVVKTVATNPDTGLPVVVPNIPAQEMSKRQMRKVREKIIKNTRNTKVVFDDEGNAKPLYELQDEESFRKQGDVNRLVDEYQKHNREVMEVADADDRELDRKKRREKKLARKVREREEMLRMKGEDMAPVLASGSEEEEEEVDREDGVLEIDDSAMTLEDQEKLALQLLG